MTRSVLRHFRCHAAGTWSHAESRFRLQTPVAEQVANGLVRLSCMFCGFVRTKPHFEPRSTLALVNLAHSTIGQWRSQPKTVGGNCFDFRRTTVFYMGRRLSKHKMTRYARNLVIWPLFPSGYAYATECSLNFLLNPSQHCFIIKKRVDDNWSYRHALHLASD